MLAVAHVPYLRIVFCNWPRPFARARAKTTAIVFKKHLARCFLRLRDEVQTLPKSRATISQKPAKKHRAHAP